MQLTAREVLGVGIFLVVWAFIEVITGTGHASRSTPGTTYVAAARVGATVSSSELGIVASTIGLSEM